MSSWVEIGLLVLEKKLTVNRQTEGRTDRCRHWTKSDQKRSGELKILYAKILCYIPHYSNHQIDANKISYICTQILWHSFYEKNPNLQKSNYCNNEMKCLDFFSKSILPYLAEWLCRPGQVLSHENLCVQGKLAGRQDGNPSKTGSHPNFGKPLWS